MDKDVSRLYEMKVKRAVILSVVALLAVAILAPRHRGSDYARGAVTQAAARTLEARSSRFTMVMNVPHQPRLGAYYGASGLMDYVNRRGRITFANGSELLIDGSVEYTRFPLRLLHDRRWLRYELYSNALNPVDLQERATRDPIGLLRFLATASSDVHITGKANVRGTVTAVYEGSLDGHKLVEAVLPERRAELQKLLRVLYSGRPRQVPFGLWLDGRGVVHRLRIIGPNDASLTIDYYDFGVPVAIVAPSAREVMTQGEFIRAIKRYARDSASTCTRRNAADLRSTPTLRTSRDESSVTFCVNSTIG
jgi:hypothetical protein